MNARIINYKGFTIELGELEGPRKAYWTVTHAPQEQNEADWRLFQDNEVECGSWEDLEQIAKRNIDAATQRQ